MNNIIHTISHSARAAAVLLIATLTAQTAGAETETVSYIDDEGKTQTVTATVLTGSEKPALSSTIELAAGWYVVKNTNTDPETDGVDVRYTNGIGYTTPYGTINIILADGAEMAVNVTDGDAILLLSHHPLAIYGQSAGTGRLTLTGSTSAIDARGGLTINGGIVSATSTVSGHSAIYTDDAAITINGGQLTATPGSYATGISTTGTITLGGGTVTSYGSYYGPVTVALPEGYAYSDGINYYANGTLTDQQKTAIAGKTLISAIIPIQQSQDGMTYTIKNATGWNIFIDMLAENDQGFFTGKTVQLDADITVSHMTNIHSFTGTFDGQGHTLTFNYGSASEPVKAQFIAPFPLVSGSATFRNLTIDGTIYADYTISEDKGVAGLIGHLYGTAAIEHCTSRITINAPGCAGGFVGLCEQSVSFTDCLSSAVIASPGSNNSGFVAWSRNPGYTIDFDGCLFNGKLIQSGNQGSGNGGFVGWKGDGQTVTITNCLVTPAAPAEGETMATGNSATFSRNGATIGNSYYTQTIGDDQGKACHTVTAGDGVNISDVALTGNATHYTASGITAYSGGGLQCGQTLYYGSGDAVSLTLSNTGAPLGYQYGYTTDAGTLCGSTLTMPDADVTVSTDTEGTLRSDGQQHDVSYVDADGTTQTAQAKALDGTETVEENGGVNLAAGWYFVGTDIAFGHSLNLYGDVNLILADGCTMSVTTTDNNKGIYSYGRNLHIYGQSEGTGALNAETQGNAEVINIINGILGIHGGNVTATVGSSNSSAIHVQRTAAGDALVIDRGTLNAYSNYGGDGIGIYIDGGDARINGGRVEATGKWVGISLVGRLVGQSTIPATLTLSGGTLNASGFFTSSGEEHPSTIAVANGYTYTDGSNFYDSTTASATLKALSGKTLQPGLAAREAPDQNYWTTYYNGTRGFTIEGNACAYTARYGGSQLTLHKLGKEIPKNTAVIIVADNDVVSMTATVLPAYSSPTNDLRGVDVDTPVADIHSALGTGTLYVLGMTTVNNEQHFGFHRYTGSEMAAHKAFVLVGNSQAPTRSLMMVFDGATAIESLTPDAAPKAQAADHWFTLDGRRLQAKPTAPGIYINNGKKVVIK